MSRALRSSSPPLPLAALLVLAAGCGSSSYSAEPLSTDEATAACVTYASCMGGTVTACFGQIMPALDNEQVRCVAHQGKDCVGAAACLGTTISLSRGCETDEYSCDGSKQVMCYGAATTYLDCGELPQAGGPTCVMGSTGRPMCGIGSCTETETTCEGDLLTQCLANEGVRIVATDCGAKGMTCGTVASVATCIGTGPACETALPHCDGALVVSCLGGQEATADCAGQLVDGICVDGEIGARCLLGSECDAYQSPETCVDDTVTFCAAGVQRTAKCSDFGFGPCVDGRCQAYPSY
jgi:hypothetical protein